jgi:hypothetical protein
MVERWYHPKVHTGWHKDQPPEVRRKEVLKAHKNDLLASGRSLQALSNVSTDNTTKVLAARDARYFFDKHKKEIPRLSR